MGNLSDSMRRKLNNWIKRRGKISFQGSFQKDIKSEGKEEREILDEINSRDGVTRWIRRGQFNVNGEDEVGQVKSPE